MTGSWLWLRELFAAFLRRKWDSVGAHSEREGLCISGKALGCNYRAPHELHLRQRQESFLSPISS